MPTTSTSLVQPEILENNKTTINSFLKQSYEQAKKQIETGVSFIQDSVSYIQEGVSFLKDEFSSFYHESGQCLSRMSLPVNNFLKDHTQIETELLQEISKESAHLMLMNGEMVPVEKVLGMPMEENH
jgi:hypothetical protein